MNTKPIKEWTYDELMVGATWLIIEAITKGEQLKRAMYEVDNLITSWRKQKGIKI